MELKKNKSAPMRLRRTIKMAIEALFERAKARLLGRFYDGPKIFFQIVRDFGVEDSLEGAYRHAAYMGSGSNTQIDHDTADSQADETSAIMNSLKTKAIKDLMQAAKVGDTTKIKEVFKTTESHMDMIIATETRKAQSFGEHETVVQVAQNLGIENPTIIFRGVLDGKTCKWCLAMYHSKSNPKIPRTWKNSQLSEEYFNPKTWNGTTVHRSGHPRCRHSMSVVIPGMGFNNDGYQTFIHRDYDEYEKQKREGDT